MSVVVLTYNEAVNVEACLQSLVNHFADIQILDSGSTDGTLEIANKYPVSVHSHPFSGFGAQRNWAIDHIPSKYAWTLHLDADERVTPEVVGEMAELIARNPSEAGFFVPSKLMLGGRWLRYSSGFPVYQVRLFHRERLRFEDHGHGQREVTTGQLGYMKNAYIHEAYNKGLDDWFAKHARYARHEAEVIAGTSRGILQNLKNLFFASTPVIRRRALKSLAYSLPFRPELRILHSLIVKRGLLDGGPGWTYARLLAAYESMISAHLSRIKSGIDL